MSNFRTIRRSVWEKNTHTDTQKHTHTVLIFAGCPNFRKISGKFPENFRKFPENFGKFPEIFRKISRNFRKFPENFGKISGNFWKISKNFLENFQKFPANGNFQKISGKKL